MAAINNSYILLFNCFFEFHVWHMVSKGFWQAKSISGTLFYWLWAYLSRWGEGQGQIDFKREL